MMLRVKYAGLDRVAAVIGPEDGRIAVPEYLMVAATERWPDRQVLPHYALAPGSGVPDLTVLHKGLLTRLSLPVLRDILANGLPVFADEDFLVLRPAARVAGEVRADWRADAARLADWATGLPRAEACDRQGTALIASAYGLGNIGDDAVTVVAGRIAAAAGFRRVILAGAIASFDLVREADIVMLGGGGLLYDTADGGKPVPQNVAYYGGLLRHAQELGRRTAVLGIGVQGIHTSLGRAAYGQILRHADHVSVRDPDDLQVIRQELGVAQAELAADLGFGIGTWVWPRTAAAVVRPLALVVPGVLSARITAEADASWIGLIRHLGRDHEVIIVQHAGDDRELCARLASATGARLDILTRRGVVGAAALYRRAAVVATARYHGLVFGLVAGCRLLPVTTPGGKQGRLIRWALPSLAAALTPIDRFLGGDTAALLAKVALPEPAEVAALQARVADLPARLAASVGAPPPQECLPEGVPALA